ncbi:MAG: hypothetical protein PHN72_01925 [Bacilli bacterium]|nr:hypothetical protein [Bacilli bacterium]
MINIIFESGFSMKIPLGTVLKIITYKKEPNQLTIETQTSKNTFTGVHKFEVVFYN